MAYNKLEKIIARAIDYHVGETDDDKPSAAVLPIKAAKIGLYVKLAEKLIGFVTCIFIMSSIVRHWG